MKTQIEVSEKTATRIAMIGITLMIIAFTFMVMFGDLTNFNS